MSERTVQDNQDQILKTALKELERNKGILTGRQFRKCYQFPWLFLVLIFSILPLFCTILILVHVDFALRYEVLKAVFLATIVGDGMFGLGFIISGIDNINQRIDKIIELTGVETKLEEKYYSNIKAITGSYPEKVNS
jgi:hypothetical protein